MKKILLGTTTLIGAAALLAGNAFADTPKVTVGGYENFEVGYEGDYFSNSTTARRPTDAVDQRPQAFRSDTQVDFKIDGKNDSGLGYGGEVDLLADTSADIQGRGVNASKTFIYADGNSWGRFELGSNVGADGTMKVDAGTIARATGGVDGDWTYFANSGSQFLAMSSLPTAYGNIGSEGLAAAGVQDNMLGNHTQENLNKITYYTPRFYGVQLGLSYLPDEENRGQGTGPFTATLPNPQGPDRTDGHAGLSSNIFSGGANYDAKFGDFGFTAAATGQWGRAQVSNYEDLKAWNAGAKLSWMGWSLAGSYGDWGKSNTLSGTGSKDTWYWDIGAAYEYGPFGASVTYLNSQFDCGNVAATTGATAGCGDATVAAGGVGKNKFQSVSGGVDYKLAPGLTPYAEVTFFDQDAALSAQDNKGYVGIIGTQLNF